MNEIMLITFNKVFIMIYILFKLTKKQKMLKIYVYLSKFIIYNYFYFYSCILDKFKKRKKVFLKSSDCADLDGKFCRSKYHHV
jgi:hypothetical protein